MIPIPNLSLAAWLKIGGGLIAVLLLALLLHDRNHWKSTATLRQSQLVAEQAANAATVANYRGAAERARREDAENLARVKADQATINERTSDDFENRIAAARARADSLHRNAEAAAANPGGGGAKGVPGVPAAAKGVAEAAGQDGLPQSDRLTATEQAIQLDELVKWAIRQHAVDPNAEAPK